MGGRILFGVSLSRKFGLMALPCVAAPLVACAAPSSYMGISLIADATSVDVQRLAQLAKSGDKQAQLDLGIRFEEGLGVERDLGKATKLYRAAATDTESNTWVYTPPVGNGTSGRVISVSSRERQYGYADARLRLERLLESMKTKKSRQNVASITPDNIRSGFEGETNVEIQNNERINVLDFSFDVIFSKVVLLTENKIDFYTFFDYIDRDSEEYISLLSTYDCSKNINIDGNIPESLVNICQSKKFSKISYLKISPSKKDVSRGYYVACQNNYQKWISVSRFNPKFYSQAVPSDFFFGQSYMVQDGKGMYMTFDGPRECITSLYVAQGL